jgi:hypothetical protein
MSSFGVVIVAVAIVAGIVAIVVSIASGGLYERIGKGAFSLDGEEPTRAPAPGSAAAKAEADEEIRQLVEAKSARRVMRGEAPLDVEAEVASLTSKPVSFEADGELREEVRQLVVARNRRRVARGEEPLDVDAEVERQLRELGA